MFGFTSLLNVQVRTILLLVPNTDVASIKNEGICLHKVTAGPEEGLYKVMNPNTFALGALVAWFAPHNFRLKKVGPNVRIEKM